MQGGPGLGRVQRIDGRAQGHAVAGRRELGTHHRAKGQQGGAILLPERIDPGVQRLTDAGELGRIERARDIHQKDRQHALIRRAERRGGDHLRHPGAKGRLELPRVDLSDRRARLVADRDIGGDRRPLGQCLRNGDLRRRAGVCRHRGAQSGGQGE